MKTLLTGALALPLLLSSVPALAQETEGRYPRPGNRAADD